MDNLVQLCRRHHPLVHEGDFGCERRPDGRLVFRDQRGNILDNAIVADNVANILILAGLEKRNIGLLSDEFLEDVRKMDNRNTCANGISINVGQADAVL